MAASNPTLSITVAGYPLPDFIRSLITRVEESLKKSEVELYEKEAMMLLREYALCPDDKLTYSAKQLKKLLVDIAKIAIREEGPNTILDAIDQNRKKIDNLTLSFDGDYLVDKDYAKGMLDDLQKVVDQTFYRDGKTSVMLVLCYLREYLTRRIAELSQDASLDGNYTYDVEGSEEAILRARVDAAIQAVKA